jgi:hypothetical protein
MMKENLGEFLELEDERRGKGRLGFQTWVRIFGMLQPPGFLAYKQISKQLEEVFLHLCLPLSRDNVVEVYQSV